MPIGVYERSQKEKERLAGLSRRSRPLRGGGYQAVHKWLVEKQVCSLEVSKKLKELGVKQSSYFSYYFFSQKKHMSDEWYKPRIIIQHEAEINDDDLWEERYDEICSAFTVAELGELLPQDIWIDKKRYCVEYQLWSDREWFVNYRFTDDDKLIPEDQYNYEQGNYCLGPTEADARAKMLIYLIENKLIIL